MSGNNVATFFRFQSEMHFKKYKFALKRDTGVCETTVDDNIQQEWSANSGKNCSLGTSISKVELSFEKSKK